MFIPVITKDKKAVLSREGNKLSVSYDDGFYDECVVEWNNKVVHQFPASKNMSIVGELHFTGDRVLDKWFICDSEDNIRFRISVNDGTMSGYFVDDMSFVLDWNSCDPYDSEYRISGCFDIVDDIRIGIPCKYKGIDAAVLLAPDGSICACVASADGPTEEWRYADVNDTGLLTIEVNGERLLQESYLPIVVVNPKWVSAIQESWEKLGKYAIHHEDTCWYTSDYELKLTADTYSIMQGVICVCRFSLEGEILKCHNDRFAEVWNANRYRYWTDIPVSPCPEIMPARYEQAFIYNAVDGSSYVGLWDMNTRVVEIMRGRELCVKDKLLFDKIYGKSAVYKLNADSAFYKEVSQYAK